MISKDHLLFIGSNYYPQGGASDFACFGSLEELKELYIKNWSRWQKAAVHREIWGQVARASDMVIVIEWHQEKVVERSEPEQDGHPAFQS